MSVDLAHACSCVPMAWQERLRVSDAIFLGRVVDVQPLAFVVLDVRETFKGRLGRRVRVPTGESDCDYFLPPVVADRGMDFLVFATVHARKVTVSRCLGSGRAGTKADELALLRRR